MPVSGGGAAPLETGNELLFHCYLFPVPPAFLLDLRVSRLKLLSRWDSTSSSLYATCFNCAAKLHIFHGKRAECATFYSSSQRIEYDSNNFAGICISVAILRHSLSAARTSSITSDASWCSIM